LRWYAAAVVGYAGVKASAPQFLARGDTRTPMLCSLAGIGANLVVALAWIEPLGYRALALAVVVGTGVNFLLLRGLSWRSHGWAAAPGLSFVLRVCVAAGAMGAAGLGLLELLGRPGGGLTLVLCVGLAGLYFVVAALLRLPEAGFVGRRLGLGGRRSAPPGP